MTQSRFSVLTRRYLMDTDIQAWFENGVEMGATHMLIVSDLSDDDEFPVFVQPDQNVHSEVVNQGESPQHVLAVYVLDETRMEALLAQDRPFVYD